LAPAVLLSIPGFRIMPGVWAVVSGDAVPLTTRSSLPLIEVLILPPLISAGFFKTVSNNLIANDTPAPPKRQGQDLAGGNFSQHNR